MVQKESVGRYLAPRSRLPLLVRLMLRGLGFGVEGCPAIRKLTSWVRGTNPSTLGRKIVRTPKLLSPNSPRLI